MRHFLIFATAVAASVTPAGVAFADTVSAGAKPVIVGFFGLAALLFAAGGYFFIARGMRTRRIARDSAHWPVAEGKILSLDVKEETRNPTGDVGGRYTVYIPAARYSYAVAGKRYEGNVIRPGIEQFGYARADAAQFQLAPYKTGGTTPVRYDPADPSVATLEAAEYGGARNIFGGTISALLALGMLGSAIYFVSLATH